MPGQRQQGPPAVRAIGKCFHVFPAAAQALEASKQYVAAGIHDDIATRLYTEGASSLEADLSALFEDMLLFMTAGRSGRAPTRPI